MEPFKVDIWKLPILKEMTLLAYTKWRAAALDTIQLYGGNVVHPVRLLSRSMAEGLALTWEPPAAWGADSTGPGLDFLL